MESNPTKNLEESLIAVLEQSRKQPITIKDLVTILSKKAPLLLILVLSLPFCLAIGIPFLSTVFGLMIVFFSFAMIFSTTLWLPECLLKKEIPQKPLEKTLLKGLKLFTKINRWVHSRFLWISTSFLCLLIHRIFLILLGLLLALPLPIPFTNVLTAWPIFLISLGLLKSDGLLILLGYVIFFLGFIFFILFFFLAKAAVTA